MLTVNKGHHGIEQRVVRTSTNVRSQPVQLVINVRPRLFLAFVPRCSSRIFSHGLASPEEDFGRKAPWLCRSTLIFPGLQRHAGPSSSSPFGSPVPPLSAQSNAVGADDVLTHHPGHPEEINRSRARFREGQSPRRSPWRALASPRLSLAAPTLSPLPMNTVLSSMPPKFYASRSVAFLLP